MLNSYSKGNARQHSHRLTVLIVSLAAITLNPALTLQGQAPVSYDGTYVPSPRVPVPPRPPQSSCPYLYNDFGMGFIVAGSIGTFDLGVQPKGDKRVRPLKVSARVGADGAFSASKGQVTSISGHFNGPAEKGSSFIGEITLNVNHLSCSYPVTMDYAGPTK